MSETNLFDGAELNGMSLAEIIRRRIIGIHPDDLDTRLDDADWEEVLTALDSSARRRCGDTARAFVAAWRQKYPGAGFPTLDDASELLAAAEVA